MLAIRVGRVSTVITAGKEAVTNLGLDTFSVGNKLEDLCLCLLEGGGRYVGQHNAGALLGKQDGCLQTDATGAQCQHGLIVVLMCQRTL
jgi:hypothetical protein